MSAWKQILTHISLQNQSWPITKLMPFRIPGLLCLDPWHPEDMKIINGNIVFIHYTWGNLLYSTENLHDLLWGKHSRFIKHRIMPPHPEILILTRRLIHKYSKLWSFMDGECIIGDPILSWGQMRLEEWLVVTIWLSLRERKGVRKWDVVPAVGIPCEGKKGILLLH